MKSSGSSAKQVEGWRKEKYSVEKIVGEYINLIEAVLSKS
jgi:hypothetical protein